MVTTQLETTSLTRKAMSEYYASCRNAAANGEKVAWTTASMPTEILVAAGLHTNFPENHSATCGAKQLNPGLVELAESAGLSQDTCSYARSELGVRLGGASPWGGMPRPDILVTSNCGCQTVTKWFEDLARHFDCPLCVIDMPYCIRGEISDHAVEYIVNQFGELIEEIERLTGRPYDYDRFREVVRLSQQANEYYRKCIDLGRFKPSPITTNDLLINMGPMVCLRGTEVAVEIYRRLYEELAGRAESGHTAVPGGEKYRVLWDNIPLWYALGPMERRLTDWGVGLVTASYYHFWVRDIDPDNAFDSLARGYAGQMVFNTGISSKIELVARLAADFDVDGVIIHSNRSCKPDALGIFDLQRELLARNGIPALIFEADHTDPRAYAAGAIDTRMEAFVESLAQRKTAAANA